MKTLTSEAIVRFISSQQMLQSLALKEILMLKPSTPKQNTETCDPAAGKKRGTSAPNQSSEGSNLRVQDALSTAVASNRPTEALASVISFTFVV